MKTSLPKFANQPQALELIARLGKEFAIVRNPTYVFPPYEAYPLAPKIRRFKKGVVGIVKDMDGTTTTTEALCLHSLETMVRRFGDKPGQADWAGFDRERDLPHIIGNSTTRHVEYLVHTYQSLLKPEAFQKALIEAAAWTLAVGKDPGRREEVRNDLMNLGLSEMAGHADFKALLEVKSYKSDEARRLAESLAKRFGRRCRMEEMTDLVRGAIDIYYYRYHEILMQVKAGKGAQLSGQILEDPKRRLIEPMPGVAIFLCLVRGWLEGDCQFAEDELCDHLRAHKFPEKKIQAARGRLAPLADRFAKSPLRIAVVTSSIQYEAEIVLTEVFRVIREQIAQWPLPARTKELLAERFASPRDYYDAFITASDSSEIRLKPHRDLYSIALHRLGLSPDQFGQVIGLEDSESGTIAIRAAGVGCSVAVPFAETSGHNLDAASHIAKGGLPEVVLLENMFLAQYGVHKP